MYDSTFIPEPAMFVGLPTPPAYVGSRFYNQGQTESGQENLSSFLFAFSSVFNSEEEHQATLDKLESYVIHEDTKVPLNTDYVDFSALTDGEINENWVKGLKAAQDAKTDISEVYSRMGGDGLDNFEAEMKGAGAWDTQLLITLMQSFNKVSLAAPNVTKGQIDAMSDNEVSKYSSLLGIKNDRKALGEKINQIINDVGQMPKFNSDSLDNLGNKVKRKAIEPAVGMFAASMSMQVAHRAQSEAYEAAKKDAQEAERAGQKAENKRLAEQNHLRKESLARAENEGRERMKSQRRGKK